MELHAQLTSSVSADTEFTSSSPLTSAAVCHTCVCVYVCKSCCILIHGFNPVSTYNKKCVALHCTVKHEERRIPFRGIEFNRKCESPSRYRKEENRRFSFCRIKGILCVHCGWTKKRVNFKTKK
jgi:hypothetical protein